MPPRGTRTSRDPAPRNNAAAPAELLPVRHAIMTGLSMDALISVNPPGRTAGAALKGHASSGLFRFRCRREIGAQRLGQHAVEPQLAWITEAIDADRHGVMTGPG